MLLLLSPMLLWIVLMVLSNFILNHVLYFISATFWFSSCPFRSAFMWIWSYYEKKKSHLMYFDANFFIYVHSPIKHKISLVISSFIPFMFLWDLSGAMDSMNSERDEIKSIILSGIFHRPQIRIYGWLVIIFIKVLKSCTSRG